MTIYVCKHERNLTRIEVSRHICARYQVVEWCTASDAVVKLMTYYLLSPDLGALPFASHIKGSQISSLPFNSFSPSSYIKYFYNVRPSSSVFH
jgi:hypothetical protein